MGSYQSIPDQSGAASQAGSRQASSSVTKQIVGVVNFIVSLGLLSLAAGMGIASGFRLSPTSRLFCFVGAIICILIGLLNFGVL